MNVSLSVNLLKVALAPQLGGCSYIFTSGGSRDRCSTSVLPPVVDTLAGGFQVARTAYAIGAPAEAYEDAVLSREVDIALGVGFTALFIASAYYGYSTTNECTRSGTTLIVRLLDQIRSNCHT